jgi:ubiquinone/menaquinone biosynthesis C-methylase UbiE
VTSRYLSRYRTVRESEFEAIYRSLTQINFRNASLILDVGSGTGIQAGLFERLYSGAEVVSIDIARPTHGSHPTVIASAENMPFRSGIFQVCFSSCVLEHVKNRRQGLEEMARVTSGDGLVVGVVPNFVWKFYQFGFVFVDLLFRQRAGASTHGHSGGSPRVARFPRNMIHGEFDSNLSEVRSYTTKSWTSLFENARMRIVVNSYGGLAYSPDVFVTLLTSRLPAFLSSSTILIGIKEVA